MTSLPTDTDDNIIPALRFKSGGAHKITVNSSAARNSTPFSETTRIIGLYSTVPVYLAVGDNTVTATVSDHYFPAGVYYDIAIGGGKTAHHTHVSVLREADDGMLHISEKE